MRGPDGVRSLLSGLRAAVAFLTRLPVDPSGRAGAAAVAGGAVWFPLVGAFTGGVSALTAWAMGLVLPAAVAALGAVAAGVLLTGALHVDGLADTADGYGAATADRALEIMRDHSVGTYGVVSVVLDVGLRVAAIASLAGRPGGLLYLVAAGAVSRSAMVGLGALVPYARRTPGLGGLLSDAPRSVIVWSVLLGTALAVLAVRLPGLAAAALAGVLAAGWGWHCARRLGGITGDTLGAASEGCEVAVLLLGAVWR
jgi:cobalamin 5'-phosphate synthase/cobalamin synthase